VDDGGAVLDGPVDWDDGADLEGLLLLARDVLDVQVVDIASAGWRASRRSTSRGTGRAALIAVDVGWHAILRRLGLRRLARRASRDGIDWAGIHLASGPGHALQLASPSAAVHRVDPAAVAELLARLPTIAGARCSTRSPTRGRRRAGDVHPELGADLVEVLAPGRASPARQMEDDAAAGALRDADPDRRESLLAAMDPDRARQLRLLIARAPSGSPRARPARRYWRIARGTRAPR